MEKKVDLRVQRTKKAILETFFSLLEEKHFSNISVIDICEKALINRGTFYTHFQDKNQLLEKIVYDMMMNFDDEVDKVHGDSDMLVYYNDIFDVSLAFIYENRARLKTLITNADATLMSNQAHAVIKNNIMKKVGRLPSTTEISLEILAEFFAGGLIQVVSWWVQTDCNVPAEEIKTQLFGLVKNILVKFNA
ncbi:MAG: TetR/AcrR family transcriptional regulator C-terminal domain-containing protein [Clostridia bacterium]|nr:TetR/AcrR family transcriptional regulator C-terminal domain-containing protein [Clostridia bacterium]